MKTPEIMIITKKAFIKAYNERMIGNDPDSAWNTFYSVLSHSDGIVDVYLDIEREIEDRISADDSIVKDALG